MTTSTYTAVLVHETCCTCSIPFGLDRDHYNRLRKSHDWFYCPAGHRQHYVSQSDVEVAQERAARAERRATQLVSQLDQANAEAEHNARRANGYKGALTKVKKRLGQGKCPCCSHEFKDVAAHMRRMHPEHVDDAS